MAAIQSLRNNARWFMTAIVFIALFAFVVNADDLRNWFNTNSNVVGKINGEKVKIDEYQRRINEVEDFTKLQQGMMSIPEAQQIQLREQIWQQMVQEKVMGDIYEEIGVVVTPNEVYDMVTGNHISPMVRSFFTNQETGVYDRAMADNFLRNKNGDPQASFYWNFIEKNLIINRLNEKYLSLFQKSIIYTDAQLKVEKQKRSSNVDMSYVAVRYTSVPDSTITITDKEIKSKYDKSKELYKVSESRDIEYVSFPIKPTDEDRDETMKLVESLKADFESEETDAYRFAQMNSENPTGEVYMTESQLEPEIANFVKSAKEGEVYGPYRDGDSYKLSRLVKIAQRPDSVKASHILITESRELADSIFDVAKKGGNFADLARKYSVDNGSAINGGDLDWFQDGRMVPTFNEACFTGKKGDIVEVESEYGIHIIKITDVGKPSTKYSVATIDKSIQFSQKTYQKVYGDANEFISSIKTNDQFNSMIDSLNLVKRYAQNIRPTAHSINSIASARDIVKWAYEAELNEISDIFDCGDEFVIATLVKKQDKGYADLKEVSASITREIRNEKKVSIIADKFNGKSLAEIAEANNANVDSASNVNFYTNTIAGAGVEPSLVGRAVAAEQGKVIGAVEGHNAVYFFEVNNKTENSSIDDEQIKMSYEQQLSNLGYSVVSNILENADIEDNRIRFY
ncbi:MAG: peptidylprolyl isomerase [Bacteroidales bacterium]|nr:peptidylprolyl isomerase [Bacteroidales bacterium]